MTGRTALAMAAALAATFCVAIPAVAQTSRPSDIISEVRVEGAKSLTSAAVLSYARVRAGEKVDDALIRDDQERMLKSGYFEDVKVIKTPTDKGVIITFVVAERAVPRIEKITVTGNKAFKLEKLMGELPFRVGDAMSENNVEAGRQGILKKYRDEGYYYVEVTVDRAGLAKGEVNYRVVEGPQSFIRKILFEGNTYFGWFRLYFSIESKERFWPFISGKVDDEMIARDADTLRNMYVGEGFLDAEVDARKTDSPDKTKVTLTFRIRQGPRYRVNKVIVNGCTVFREEEILRRMHLKQGQFYTAMWQERDLKALRDMYGELGYIEARVEVRKQFLPPDATLPAWAMGVESKPALLNVVYDVVEHDQFTVGRIDITGNHNTQARVIRRQLRFYPEQLFNTVAVEDSRKALLESGLFSDVRITPVGDEPNVRNALVQVTEAQTGKFMLGAGISSRDGLIGNITFTQRNFDILGWPSATRQKPFTGAGQTLSITAEPGIEVMRFYIDWTEPALMDQPLALRNRIFIWSRERETYRETRYGDIISLGRRFPNLWYAELAQRIEGVTIDNLDSDAPREVRSDKGSHLILGTKGSVVLDRTDSRFLPTKGDRLSLSYEQVYGEYNFGKPEAEYHIYQTVYRDALDRPHVLAGKVAFGDIIGSAPVFEKYYGGGLGSIRGFKYRGISPRSGNDEPIGGKFNFFAGAEYSYPIIAQAFRGVIFVDSGTVEKDIGFTTYRVSVGFGFRLMLPAGRETPLGPSMGVDFGFPIMKDSSDDTEIVSFNVGWTF
ncbi:MAG: outer membrane protein assembly factor BamA [Phycisphaerae bacterium]